MKIDRKSLKSLLLISLLMLNSYIQCERVYSKIDFPQEEKTKIPTGSWVSGNPQALTLDSATAQKIKIFKTPKFMSSIGKTTQQAGSGMLNKPGGDNGEVEDVVFDGYFEEPMIPPEKVTDVKFKVPADISSTDAETKYYNYKPDELKDANWNFKHVDCSYTYAEYSSNFDYFFPSLGEYVGHCRGMKLLNAEVKLGHHMKMIGMATDAFYKSLPKDFCYLPSSQTKCPAGYTDCFGGCAATGLTCALTVIRFIYKFIKTALHLALNVASGGLSGFLVGMIKKMSSTGWGYFTAGFDIALTFLSTVFSILKTTDRRDAYIKRMVVVAVIDNPSWSNDVNEIKTYCEKVFDQFRESYSADFQSWDKGGWTGKLKVVWNTIKTLPFDPNSISTAINGCSSGDLNAACIKGVIGTLTFLDPTGILSLVNSFIYSYCPPDEDTLSLKLNKDVRDAISKMKRHKLKKKNK